MGLLLVEPSFRLSLGLEFARGESTTRGAAEQLADLAEMRENGHAAWGALHEPGAVAEDH